MHIDNLPILATQDLGNIVDPLRPILSLSWETPQAMRVSAHVHPRAHIIVPIHGACWVATIEHQWLVPMGQAVWIDSMVYHEVYCRGPVSAHMLFIDPSCAVRLSHSCQVVNLNRLFLELTARALQHGNNYSAQDPMARLTSVILDELTNLPPSTLLLPISKDARLEKAINYLLQHQSANVSLEELADVAGASLRTMARLFQRETGMTYSQWKTRMLLLEAIERLTRGDSITDIALHLGYNNTSSFVYMFRTNVGVPPGKWLIEQVHHSTHTISAPMIARSSPSSFG